jgi:hypothetical protein
VIGLTSIEPGDRNGLLIVVDTSGTNDEGEIVVHCRCACGVRKLLSVDEFRKRSKCSLFCTTETLREPAPIPLYRTSAARLAGRPGVSAIGSTRSIAAKRPTLERFLDDPVTRYLVVYADGSRMVAESFSDAQILYRHPDLSHTFGLAAAA